MAQNHHRGGPDDDACQHDRPPAARPIHQASGDRSRAGVEHRLQREQVADLGGREAEPFPGEDGDECPERAPGQRHADQPDHHGRERHLPGQRSQWSDQREPLPGVLTRLAGRQRAGNREDEQRGRHGDVSPHVDPPERKPGEGGAEREAELHRERQPSHRAPELSPGHRFGYRAEHSRLLGAGGETADDLPEKQGTHARGECGRELRESRQHQRDAEQRAGSEAVHQHPGRQRQDRGGDGGDRKQGADLKPARAQVVGVERNGQSACRYGRENRSGRHVEKDNAPGFGDG